MSLQPPAAVARRAPRRRPRWQRPRANNGCVCNGYKWRGTMRICRFDESGNIVSLNAQDQSKLLTVARDMDENMCGVCRHIYTRGPEFSKFETHCPKRQREGN